MSLRWNAIRAALETKLAAFPGGYQIAWTNKPFPPTTSTWLRPTVIPAAVDAAMTMTGDTHERGIFQVSIFAPPNTGAGTLFTVLDALSTYLDRARLAGTGVTVQLDVPVPGPLIEEPDWLHLPLSINFLAL